MQLQVLGHLLVSLLLLAAVLAGVAWVGATAVDCYQKTGAVMCPQTVVVSD